MKIAFCLFGVSYGVKNRDFRHCWPNINSMLIEPFRDQGHEIEIYTSTYKFENDKIRNDFFTLINPSYNFFSNFEGSDGFTAKYALFNLLEKSDCDIVIVIRFDAHWSKKIAFENIDFTKFNFLFPEKGWYKSHQFTCDNFYIWPNNMTTIVKKAMLETYRFPRPQYVDTHGLMTKLKNYLSDQQINMISVIEQLSDINMFYTVCRNELPCRDVHLIHQEVKDRFNIK